MPQDANQSGVMITEQDVPNKLFWESKVIIAILILNIVGCLYGIFELIQLVAIENYVKFGPLLGIAAFFFGAYLGYVMIVFLITVIILSIFFIFAIRANKKWAHISLITFSVLALIGSTQNPFNPYLLCYFLLLLYLNTASLLKMHLYNKINKSL